MSSISADKGFKMKYQHQHEMNISADMMLLFHPDDSPRGSHRSIELRFDIQVKAGGSSGSVGRLSEVEPAEVGSGPSGLKESTEELLCSVSQIGNTSTGRMYHSV